MNYRIYVCHGIIEFPFVIGHLPLILHTWARLYEKKNPHLDIFNNQFFIHGMAFLLSAPGLPNPKFSVTKITNPKAIVHFPLTTPVE